MPSCVALMLLRCRVGQYIVRLVAVAISVGGMLITALMLGIVSGTILRHWICLPFASHADLPKSSALRPDTRRVKSTPGHSEVCRVHALPCSLAASPSWCPADAISDKIEDLKKGRSDVLEVRGAGSLLTASVHPEMPTERPCCSDTPRTLNLPLHEW